MNYQYTQSKIVNSGQVLTRANRRDLVAATIFLRNNQFQKWPDILKKLISSEDQGHSVKNFWH